MVEEAPRVVALVGSEDERVAPAASQEVLNRAYEKPTQQVFSEVQKTDNTKLWLEAMKMVSEADDAARRDAAKAINVIHQQQHRTTRRRMASKPKLMANTPTRS